MMTWQDLHHSELKMCIRDRIWIGPAILSAVLLVVIVYAILGINCLLYTSRCV